MPIYEYTCEVCNTEFQKLLSLRSMDMTISCPDCGSRARRKFSVFSAFSSSGNGPASPISGGGGCCGGGGGSCACSSRTVSI